MARQLGIKGDLRINVRRYIEILRPFGKLTAQEGKVLSEFVLEYYSLKKKVSDEKLLWDIVMEGLDVRERIADKLEIERYALNTLVWRLKKKGAITGGKVHPVYIPEIKDSKFSLTFLFKVE